MHLPRLTIGGTQSGCGKTTLTLALVRALVKKGIAVAPFKSGPDYLDTQLLSRAAGRPARNCDSFLLRPEFLRGSFALAAAGAEMAVAEGVMGLYDGLYPDRAETSTAEVARLLGNPVVLVVNASGTARSSAAVVEGFRHFPEAPDIAGVFFNRVSGEHHYQLLKEALESVSPVKALGWLPADAAVSLPSRHLGLVPGAEVEDLEARLDAMADLLIPRTDWEALMAVAASAGPLLQGEVPDIGDGRGVRLGVARDAAFNFYYEDNFTLYQRAGVVLVPFSPLRDSALPEGLHGILLGGGYPETFAGELEANGNFIRNLCQALGDGLICHGECGGMMYLGQQITGSDGGVHRMAGFLPLESRMTGKLQRFGYIEVEAEHDSPLMAAGMRIRAHEFHYSTTRALGADAIWRVDKAGRSGRVWNCGYQKNRTVAGYPHLHLWSNPEVGARFLQQLNLAATADRGRQP